jgi:hypothetical protein
MNLELSQLRIWHDKKAEEKQPPRDAKSFKKGRRLRKESLRRRSYSKSVRDGPA